MKKIVWASTARTSLAEIIGYIGLEKPQAAIKLAQKIKEHTSKLATFPGLGHKMPKQVYGLEYRQLLIIPCRVFYRVEDNYVLIINIVRTERLFP